MDSPLDSAATVILLFLGLIVLRNWRAGTLGQWAKAKFFLQATGTDPATGKPNTSGSDPGVWIGPQGGRAPTFHASVPTGQVTT